MEDWWTNIWFWNDLVLQSLKLVSKWFLFEDRCWLLTPNIPKSFFCGETHQLGESVFFFYAASLLQAITLTGKLCGCPQLFRSFGKHISLCQKSNIDLRRLSVELRTFLTAHSASCRSLHPLHVAGGRSPISLALCKRVASGWKLGSGKWRSICESGLVQISSKILLWWTQLRFWDGVLAYRVFFWLIFACSFREIFWKSPFRLPKHRCRCDTGLDRVSSFCFWGQLGQPVEVLANSRILVVTSRVSAVCGFQALQLANPSPGFLEGARGVGRSCDLPAWLTISPRPLVTNSSWFMWTVVASFPKVSDTVCWLVHGMFGQANVKVNLCIFPHHPGRTSGRAYKGMRETLDNLISFPQKVIDGWRFLFELCWWRLTCSHLSQSFGQQEKMCPPRRNVSFYNPMGVPQETNTCQQRCGLRPHCSSGPASKNLEDLVSASYDLRPSTRQIQRWSNEPLEAAMNSALQVAADAADFSFLEEELHEQRKSLKSLKSKSKRWHCFAEDPGYIQTHWSQPWKLIGAGKTPFFPRWKKQKNKGKHAWQKDFHRCNKIDTQSLWEKCMSEIGKSRCSKKPLKVVNLLSSSILLHSLVFDILFLWSWKPEKNVSMEGAAECYDLKLLKSWMWCAMNVRCVAECRWVVRLRRWYLKFEFFHFVTRWQDSWFYSQFTILSQFYDAINGMCGLKTPRKDRSFFFPGRLVRKARISSSQFSSARNRHWQWHRVTGSFSGWEKLCGHFGCWSRRCFETYGIWKACPLKRCHLQKDPGSSKPSIFQGDIRWFFREKSRKHLLPQKCLPGKHSVRFF